MDEPRARRRTQGANARDHWRLIATVTRRGSDMKLRTGLILGCFIAFSSAASAQNILGASIPVSALGAMPIGPGIPLSDVATEMNSYIIAISMATSGMYSGFDPTMALATDLQQQ